MCGFVHLIIPAQEFTLLTGEPQLSEYLFGTRSARHLFCRICGVKSYYRPRSHPQDYSVNLNCLDASGFTQVRHVPFDGQNWEANIGGIQ